MNDEHSSLAFDEILTGTDGIAGGVYSQKAQSIISELLRGPDVRLTTSGTDALELASVAAGIEPGDTVMVPSFGFVTTALAFVRSGARIKFVDVDGTTLGMDPADVSRKLDSSVKAIVPIHYAGYPCDIGGILDVASRFDGVRVLEDNAHGFLGSLAGRPLGTFGAIGCLSFHGTKNVSCGEGGAVVVNDTDLLDRVDVALEKGTDRRRFLRGEIDKYTWRDLGSSFGLSDYLAGILLHELSEAESIQSKRRALTNLYWDTLIDHAGSLGFEMPSAPPDATPAFHLFYVLLKNRTIRNDVLADLRAEGVAASFHYPPLHQTPGGRTWGDGSAAECPTSERVADSIIRLPLDHRLDEDAVRRTASELIKSLRTRTST